MQDRYTTNTMAEGEGVEPSRPCGSTVFGTVAIARWLALPKAKTRAAGRGSLFFRYPLANSERSGNHRVNFFLGGGCHAVPMVARVVSHPRSRAVGAG